MFEPDVRAYLLWRCRDSTKAIHFVQRSGPTSCYVLACFLLSALLEAIACHVCFSLVWKPD